MTIPYIPISPVNLVCPKCGARQGQACDILKSEIEVVHVARIKTAAGMDVAVRSHITKGAGLTAVSPVDARGSGPRRFA